MKKQINLRERFWCFFSIENKTDILFLQFLLNPQCRYVKADVYLLARKQNFVSRDYWRQIFYGKEDRVQVRE